MVVDSAGLCPSCGKRRWLTKREARLVARRMTARVGRLHAYRCGEFWHLGHLPAVVVAGRLSRADLGPSNAVVIERDRAS
jgi:hypothetical protein